MSQWALLSALAAVGALFQLAWAGRRFSHLHGALAFPVGLALGVSLMFAMLCAEIHLTLTTGVIALGLVATGLAGVARHRRTPAAALWRAGAWIAAFSALTAWLVTFDMTVATPDSFRTLLAANLIGSDGVILHDAWDHLAKNEFVMLAHAPAPIIGVDFLHALTPALAASVLAAMAVGLGRAVERLAQRTPVGVLLVALTTATLGTTYMFAFHAFYIHANFASAAYLFAMVVTAWFADLEDDASLLATSALCGVAFVLQRSETPLVALIFAFLFVNHTRLPQRAVVAWLVSYSAIGVAVSIAFLVFIGPSKFVGHGRTAMLAAAVLGVVGYAFVVRRSWWQRWRNRVPLCVAILTGLVLVAALATGKLGTDSLWVFYQNVFDPTTRQWGYVPHALVAAAALSLVVPRPPAADMFVYGIPLYLAFILLLAVVHPYRLSWSDSGNRMLLHILPLCFFYLGVRFIPVLAPPRA